MFALHFVSKGIFSTEQGDLYTSLLEMRQDADYEDFVDYEEADVLPLIEPVKELIKRIQKTLFNA